MYIVISAVYSSVPVKCSLEETVTVTFSAGLTAGKYLSEESRTWWGCPVGGGGGKGDKDVSFSSSVTLALPSPTSFPSSSNGGLSSP